MLGKFGKFTLVERIAEGGMAEVFLAKQQGAEGIEKAVVIRSASTTRTPIRPTMTAQAR